MLFGCGEEKGMGATAACSIRDSRILDRDIEQLAEHALVVRQKMDLLLELVAALHSCQQTASNCRCG
jgi:hypothetical protein